MRAKIPVQGPDINVLDGGGEPARRALASPALGLAQENPIGGAVAGAGKGLPVHEGFQQPERLPILGLPVLADAPADLAQDMAGQMRYPHPGENEKAGVVSDLSQQAGSLGCAPANHTPNTAGSGPPGCDSPDNGSDAGWLPILDGLAFGWPG